MTSAIPYRRVLALVLFAFAFVLNPAFLVGCVILDESEPSFGEADMLGLLATVNDQVWVHGEHELELSLKQGSQALAGVRKAPRAGSWIRSAKACNNREFVATAAACIDSSTLAVAGTITVRDRTTGDTLVDGANVTGRMVVQGLELSNATLSLNYEKGSAKFVSDDGETFQLQSFSD